MGHESYINTVDQIARELWGKEFPTKQAAKQEMLSDKSALAASCLLSMLSKFHICLQALTADSVKEQLQVKATAATKERQEEIDRLKTAIDTDIDEFLKPRIAAHGPAPLEVIDALREVQYNRVGKWLMLYQVVPKDSGVVYAPAKGTPARKLYDAWMRTKPAAPKKRVKAVLERVVQETPPPPTPPAVPYAPPVFATAATTRPVTQ